MVKALAGKNTRVSLVFTVAIGISIAGVGVFITALLRKLREQRRELVRNRETIQGLEAELVRLKGIQGEGA